MDFVDKMHLALHFADYKMGSWQFSLQAISFSRKCGNMIGKEPSLKSFLTSLKTIFQFHHNRFNIRKRLSLNTSDAFLSQANEYKMQSATFTV